MKKSKAITLILLSGSLVFGCQDDQVRNQYATWDDCVRDYKDPSKCQEERRPTESTGMYHTYYYGPWYSRSYSRNPNYNPSVNSSRSIGVVRGGFGSSSSRVSS